MRNSKRYQTLAAGELPGTLQRSCPEAQALFLEAREEAVQAYGGTDEANRVAYAALKQKFEKRGDHWIAKALEAGLRIVSSCWNPNGYIEPVHDADLDEAEWPGPSHRALAISTARAWEAARSPSTWAAPTVPARPGSWCRSCPWRDNPVRCCACRASVTGLPASSRAPASVARAWVAPAPARPRGTTAARRPRSAVCGWYRSVVTAASTASCGRISWLARVSSDIGVSAPR